MKDVFDACRSVWNRSLGDWSDLWKRDGTNVGYAGAGKALTGTRAELAWLAGQPSVPERQVVKDLCKSISAFFDKKNPVGRPHFTKRRTGYATATGTKYGFKVAGTGLGQQRGVLRVAGVRQNPTASVVGAVNDF